MGIEETVTRVVADADWTDECTVVLRMRRKQTEMTVADAITFAGQIVEAASAALDAAQDALHPIEPASIDLLELMSPDCKAGKHPASWQDMAWSDALDAEVPCQCPCHTAAAERAA
jgi:hypothetical protein